MESAVIVQKVLERLAVLFDLPIAVLQSGPVAQILEVLPGILLAVLLLLYLMERERPVPPFHRGLKGSRPRRRRSPRVRRGRPMRHFRRA